MFAPDKADSCECTTREMRAIAREIFQYALEESSIERGFSRKLHYERGILQVGEDLYDLGTFSRVFVVSFGKAAHTSLEALITRLGRRSRGERYSLRAHAARVANFRLPVFRGRPSAPKLRIIARRRCDSSRTRCDERTFACDLSD